MSTVNGIEVRVVKAADYDRLLEFLRQHYYCDEPLTVGSEPKQQDPADEVFDMSNIIHGTCLMAVQYVDTNVNRQEDILGAVLAGPTDANEAEYIFEEATKYGPTKWGHILQLLGCLERDANVYERYGVDKALHVHVLGVDQRTRGLGVGGLLMRHLVTLGAQKNYPLLAIDCTSVYSARLCERLGMECVNTKAYVDYKDAAGKQVFCPPAPHDCVKTYAIRLCDSKVPLIKNTS